MPDSLERMGRPRALLAYGAIAVYAGWLAVSLQPVVLYDDAAMTFRYVSRLVSGHGLTYNDHERVLGISNPLYALGLSLLTLGRFEVEPVARALAVVLFVIAAVQAAALAARLSGSPIGWLAGLLLPTDVYFRNQALSGMESLLAVCLGLAVALAVSSERETTAGVFLGLAIWNKLDALLLAAAIVFAWLVVYRRLPTRIALAAAVTAAPWIGFAWWYYGSPIPHSLVTKIALGAGSPFDRWWIYDFFHGDHRVSWIVLSCASLPFLYSRPNPARAAGLILVEWFVAHAVAFSMVPLGDPYPWYLTVLHPPVLILISTWPAAIARIPAGRFIQLSAATLSLGLVLWTTNLSARETYHELTPKRAIRSWEAFDSDRRLAGIFLSQYADPKEIVDAGFGWVGFEVANPVNDLSGLNTKIRLEPAAYLVAHGSPFDRRSVPPKQPPGFVPLATFDLASELFPGYSWFVVYGTPDSAIARSGVRHLRDTAVAFERLGQPEIVEAWRRHAGR